MYVDRATCVHACAVLWYRPVPFAEWSGDGTWGWWWSHLQQCWPGWIETKGVVGTGSSHATGTRMLDDHYQMLLSLSSSTLSLTRIKHIIIIHIQRKPYQVLDKLLQVIFCRLSFLLASNDGHHFRIIVTRAVGKHHPRSKLIPDLADVSPAPSNQETMVLGLATNLNSVVLLSLEQGGRERGRERERERGREGGSTGNKTLLVECK